MSFRLLAFRPTEGCGKNHLNNLKINHLYKFYNDYEFSFKKDSKDIKSIKNKNTIPKNLYNQGEIEINISAIVGKNGSGKSSLINLFIASINQLSLALVNGKKLKTTAIILSTNDKSDEDVIHTEIVYEINNDFFSLRVDNKKIALKNINKNEEIDFELNKFFYNHIVSYSIYAFNSWEMGDWIENLFHKNDSYQTPIVITPQRGRKEDGLAGIIDINNEKYLLRQRLLSIVLSNEEYKITQNLTTKYIRLSSKDTGELFYISEKTAQGGHINEKVQIDSQEIFYEVLNKSNEYLILFEQGSSLIKNCKNILDEFKRFFKITDVEVPNYQFKIDVYILRKVCITCHRYLSYNKFLQKENHASNVDIKGFLEKMKDDDSHITLKLRQIVNFVKNYKKWEPLLHPGEIDIVELSRMVREFSKNNLLIDYLPPPIFHFELYSDNNINILNKISSGENQLIHYISSIVYHLSNLDSVVRNHSLVKYEYVNIILDEVELYFHPQFQKEFIKDLLKHIKDINLKYCKNINILILSHSPFILSDIPNQNVLFLNQGKENDQQEQFKNTFAGNISTLFSNSFFIEGGLIGSYAIEKINDLINYINNGKKDDDVEEYFNLIKIIGEPVLKKKLLEMFSNKFSAFTQKQNQQKVLEYAKMLGIEIEIKSPSSKKKNK